jgi:hypothetical protein
MEKNRLPSHALGSEQPFGEPPCRPVVLFAIGSISQTLDGHHEQALVIKFLRDAPRVFEATPSLSHIGPPQ